MTRCRSMEKLHPPGERREANRRKVTVVVTLPKELPRSFDGDVSLNGASFVTSLPIPGTSLALSFRVPTQSAPIVVQGWIIGRRPDADRTRVVVAFTNLDDDARLAIADWVGDASA